MKQTLTWHPATTLPTGDVYVGLVAVKERNPNYEFSKQMGMEVLEYAELVLPAIYVFSEGVWMSVGRDITKSVEFWTIPTYPKPEEDKKEKKK